MYRTKTYIAGDWTGDKDLIDKLYEWNENKKLLLSFVDAHEYTQSSDDSLNCSIKESLRERLNISKTFVLIVGKQTKNLKSGSCFLCGSYKGYNGVCNRVHNTDNRSFVDYECEMAIKDFNDELLSRIVVIYNYANVDKDKCPECIRDYGKHINGYYHETGGKDYWNYSEIKDAICY